MPSARTISLVAVAAIAVPSAAAFATTRNAEDVSGTPAPAPQVFTAHDAEIAAREARLAAQRAGAAPRTVLAATTTVRQVAPATVARVTAVKQRALAELYTPAWAKRWARSYLAEHYDWGDGEYQALVTLWEHESSWDYREENPTSGAYGIPQSLPGAKMASVAPDWRTNPRTQIIWGLKYIRSTYGTPSAALGHFNANNWY